RQPLSLRLCGKVIRPRLVEALRPNPAQMIEGQVAGYREQPRVEIPARIEGANLFHHAHPCLLEKVLGFRRLPDQSQQVAIQAVLIPRNQLRKRVYVPAPEPRHIAVDNGHAPLPRYRCGAYHIHNTDESRKRTQAAKAPKRAVSRGPPRSGSVPVCQPGLPRASRPPDMSPGVSDRLRTLHELVEQTA